MSGLRERLVMTMGMCRTGAFQSFTSCISTPDFIKDEGHQPHSYPNFLVNLGIVGFHGDPDILNKALKHLSGTKATSHTRFPPEALVLPAHRWGGNVLSLSCRVTVEIPRDVLAHQRESIL